MKKLTKKEEKQLLEIKRFEKKKNHNHKKGEMLKMAKKQGTQNEHKVTTKSGEEVVYKFQYPGFLEATKILDRSKNAIGIGFVNEILYKELMEHVIVEPKTNWAYWEDNEGATEVLQAAQTFLNE